MQPANFTPEEEEVLAEQVRRGADHGCPRCGARMDRRPVPPRSGVAYVRDRIWLVCRGCHRSAVFDTLRL